MSCIRKLAVAFLAGVICVHADDEKKEEKKKEPPKIAAATITTISLFCAVNEPCE